MAIVYVSIGSNIDARRNIQAAYEALTQRFGNVECSPVYESKSVGFEGDNFLNLVARFESDDSPQAVDEALKQIEDENGRDRSGPKFSSRTIDIDLLLCDDLILEADTLKLPREEIYQNAFVLLPLCDIAGENQDPKSGNTWNKILEKLNMDKQVLWRIEFDPKKDISHHFNR